MSYAPGATWKHVLPDILQISNSAGLLVGALVGLRRSAETGRELAENFVLAAATGSVLGTTLGFGFWLARAAGQAVT